MILKLLGAMTKRRINTERKMSINWTNLKNPNRLWCKKSHPSLGYDNNVKHDSASLKSLAVRAAGKAFALTSPASAASQAIPPNI